ARLGEEAYPKVEEELVVPPGSTARHRALIVDVVRKLQAHRDMATDDVPLADRNHGAARETEGRTDGGAANRDVGVEVQHRLGKQVQLPVDGCPRERQRAEPWNVVGRNRELARRRGRATAAGAGSRERRQG